jgi:hypothetical protein
LKKKLKKNKVYKIIFNYLLVKWILEEIEKEKVVALEKKQKEKASLLQLLKDNEIKKDVVAEQNRVDRENDIEDTNNYAKILEEQERKRAEYFKIRERTSPTGTASKIEAVIKEINNRNVYEEEKIRQYVREKEMK